mmetsp:Transcript_68763/g.182918  ORF Transcript_68763/g.182918 Transcript_68763/m.182918 type:complete len:447 (-) Transcript_68763:398-1738(-)
MELHIECAEIELPQHRHACLVSLLLVKLVKELAREGLARRIVLREAGAVDGLFVVAPILHELRRQLDCVPLNTRDARRRRVRHAREHVLQAVARLVEESRHLVESHQARLAVSGRRAVAREVRDRLLVEHLRLADADAHPRAATLVLRPRIRIEIEGGDVLAALLVGHMEELHVGVPFGLAALALADRDVEDALAQPKEARQHVGQREIRLELLLLKLKQLLTLPLRPKGYVPQRQRLVLETRTLGERRELLELARSGRARLGCEHLCQLVDLLDRRGHLALDRDLRVRLKAEDRGLLLLEREDLADQRLVLLAGARHESGVELLAHVTRLEVFHRRQVRRDVKPNLPRPALRRRALRAIRRRARRRRRECGRRQPSNLSWLGQGERPRLGGVQHMVAKLGRDVCELHPDGVEALLLLALERHARQLHRLQRRREDALLRVVELRA